MNVLFKVILCRPHFGILDSNPAHDIDTFVHFSLLPWDDRCFQIDWSADSGVLLRVWRIHYN